MSGETLAEVIPGVFDALMRGVHTAVPGVIESYNRDKYRAKVIPLIAHVTAKNQIIPIQAIEDVPVLIFGGNSGLIDIEFVKGDNVLLIFCESGIGGWKSSDGEKQVDPDDLSHHERSDVIAIPCLIPDGKVSSLLNVSRIKMNKDGVVSINEHFTVSL
jgi:hypothetical protein